jgi:two-component system chemotaxis sensor kinase CheA
MAWSPVAELRFEVAPPWFLSPIFLTALALVTLWSSYSAWQLWRQRQARRAAEAELHLRSTHLEQRNRKMEALLRNVRQGIFSLDREGVAQDEFSAASVRLLGRSPAGERGEHLLCPDQPDERAEWKLGLSDALMEDDPRRKALFVSLLPTEVRIAERVLSADYVPMGEGLMIALTDITAQKDLQARLAREARHLDLIASAVSDGENFFHLVEEFRDFVRIGAAPYERQAVSVLYRKVHTFKGSFAQMGFSQLTEALHASEDRLRAVVQSEPDEGLVQRMFQDPWLDALARDLGAVESTLGHDFMVRHGVATLGAEQAQAVVALAQTHVAHLRASGVPRSQWPAWVIDLVRLRHLSLLTELGKLNREAQRLAKRFEKILLPLTVEGVDAWLDAARYHDLLQNLGHALRNAVDHGIEAPMERLELGKPKEGRIVIRCRRLGDALFIEMEDDGGGINEERLRDAARELGWDSEKAQSASLLELVCADGVSSKQEASETSGRGVGMGALRQEIQRLGGAMHIHSVRHKGTLLSLSMPWPQDPTDDAGPKPAQTLEPSAEETLVQGAFSAGGFAPAGEPVPSSVSDGTDAAKL